MSSNILDFVPKSLPDRSDKNAVVIDLNFNLLSQAIRNSLSNIRITKGDSGAPSAIVSALGDPTATIGLSVVDGVSLRALRSDSAPALSQAIAPTWSAIHTFTLAPVFSSGTASQTVELTAGKALTTVAFSGTGNYIKSVSPTFTGTIIAASSNWSGTLNLSALTASTALALDASKNIVSVTNTGTGNNVLASSPTGDGTWTWNNNGINQTPTDSAIFSNSTAATFSVQQYSPSARFKAQGWANGASASQSVDFRIYTRTINSSGSSALGNLYFDSSVNGGSFLNIASISTGGTLNLSGGAAIGTTLGVTGAVTLTNIAGSGSRLVQTDASGNLSASISTSSFSSSTLTSAHIFVGNVSNVATDVAMTGDISISNAGLTAIGSNKVTLGMMAQMATASILGRSTAAIGNVEVLGTTGSFGSVVLSVSPTGTGTWTLPVVNASGIFTSTASGTGSSSGIMINAAAPTYGWSESDQSANGKIWDFGPASGILLLRAVNDASSTTANALAIARSLTTITDVSINNTTDNGTFHQLGTGLSTFGGAISLLGDLTITGASKNISFSNASAHVISTANGDLTIGANKAAGASTITIDTVPAETGNSSIVFSDNGTQRGAFASGGFIVNGIGNSKIVRTDSSGYMTAASTTGTLGSVVLSVGPTISGSLNLSSLTASTALALDASKNVVSVTNTGSGNNMLAASPTTTGTLTGAASNWSSDVRVSGNLNVGSTVFSVTSAGFVSIGGINSSVAVVLDLNPWVSGLIGSTQVGVRSSPTFASDATIAGNAIQAQVVLAASSFTQATSRGILIKDASLGGLIPSITTLIGLDIETQTKGGTNLAIRTGASGAVQIGNLTASQAAFTDASKNIVSNAITGSGNVVMSASPTLTGTITAAIANFSGQVTVTGGNVGIGTTSPASLNSRSTVLEISAANDASVKLPGIVLRGNGTAFATNPAWEIFINNPSGTTTGFNISSGTTNYLNIDSNGVSTFSGDVKLGTAGNGYYVKEGTNATMGSVTLVLGTKTVSTTKVTANSRIFLCSESLGTITSPVALAVTGRSAGASFTITSANLTDTSTVAWFLLEPA